MPFPRAAPQGLPKVLAPVGCQCSMLSGAKPGSPSPGAIPDHSLGIFAYH